MTECRRRGGSVTDLAVRTCVLDMVVPVHNEERDLPRSVRGLHSYLATEVPYASQITVADNASTDSTLAVAQALADELPRRRRHSPRRQGTRWRAVHRLDVVGGGRGRVHGCRSVDRPVGVDAPCGAADFGSLR